MANQKGVPIFLSSAHYGLEDLRGELAAYLEEFGASPLLSSEAGFPDLPGIPPYAQCLRVLEGSLIVIGVIDRRYGHPFDEWGPYEEYKGLSPTHGELRHALKVQKRLMVFVRSDVRAYYDVYRQNKDAFKDLKAPAGLDLKTLLMFEELKTANPAPWIEEFRDVRDIKESIRRRLLYDLHEALRQREALARVGAEILMERILSLEPDLRKQLEDALPAAGASSRDQLTKYIEQLRMGRQTQAQANSAEEWPADIEDLEKAALATRTKVEIPWSTFAQVLLKVVSMLS